MRQPVWREVFLLYIIHRTHLQADLESTTSRYQELELWSIFFVAVISIDLFSAPLEELTGSLLALSQL